MGGDSDRRIDSTQVVHLELKPGEHEGAVTAHDTLLHAYALDEGARVRRVRVCAALLYRP